ncbi:MAG: RagB/SusD family nutrient uptake outer membrane protein [Prevotellaceae bacterium]|nr:RagB/SusD family nutrient uptake outer membrane protein [Prevotella sp.]MDD7530878.1 RagB/SusD family nutrient uptake outer membrane protein [Prevotellaceae bacterium]MDY2633243.1 RagB/SusD family nutrient uptake outer membrane protein [Prevotella sp.]
MKRHFRFKHIFPAIMLMLAFGMTSCTGDLDVENINPNNENELDVNALFNKCYANLAMAGNGGANGDTDIDGLDGGTTGFVRQMFNANELTTDEAICAWGDNGIAQFNFNQYDASHPMLRGYFYRLINGISYCNKYVEVAGDHDKRMTAEIRFLRAFQYYLLADAFGNIPFALTDKKADKTQYTRKQVYDFLEKELLAIEPDLADAAPKTSAQAGYGRVDKAAAWLLLSRLYLNAEVFTGTAQWQKAADYAEKVMNSSYLLSTNGRNGWSAYQMLFMGDNGESAASAEAIFPILQDGLKTTSWGTSLFLIASTFSTDMNNPSSPTQTNGVSGQAWGGNRARPDLIRKFFPGGDVPEVNSYEMPLKAHDDRAIFWGKDRSLDNGAQLKDVGTFKNGYSVAKFVNFKSDGSAASSTTFADADFFMLRKAEAYLNYAEATARLNGGSTTQAGTDAVNALRKRANAQQKAGYSLQDLCDEWSREFYFEGLRRPTLVRFGFFGGNNGYKWQWKGGTFEGRDFEAYKNVFAIPTDELSSSGGRIVQNNGYK